MQEIVLGWMQGAFAALLTWLAVIGAGGLLLLGIALILYSTVAIGLLRVFAAPLGIIAIVAGLWLAFGAYGEVRHAAGAAEVRAEWDRAVATERVKQASVRMAVEEVGRQMVVALNMRMAGIEKQQQEVIDAAKDEDAKPIPTKCRDVYRGLPPGVLQRLDAVGR